MAAAPRDRTLWVAGALALAWIGLSYRGLLPARDRYSLIAIGITVLVAATLVAVPRWATSATRVLCAPSDRAFAWVAAGLAAAASLALVYGPLRARPLSVDANVYLFEARALSHLHFGTPVPEPHQEFGGRFLFEGADGRLHGVFPPGFPLFLAFFVRAGAPLLAGPVLAAALVGVQCRLGAALSADPTDRAASRVAVLVALPCFARALETADLLSHAFVAVLLGLSLVLALELEEAPASRGRALLLGAALGLATAARLLDGVVASALVLALLLYRRTPARTLALVAVGAVPFVVLVLSHQLTATGHLLRPTQAEHFARSDFPPTCHRLGFGRDVGCMVEHDTERLSFGVDGYGPRAALRVVSERAAQQTGDLFGIAPLALLAFFAPALRRSRRDLALLCAALAFTLSYGLFYYGNAPIFGARHLFPLAPALWWLAARAVAPRPALLLVLPLAAGLAAIPRWTFGAAAIRHQNADRVDLRQLVDERGIARGIFVTADELSFIGAYDGWQDGPDRILVRFDGAGLLELRRRRPDLGVHSLLTGDVHDARMLPPPRPGLTFEIERAWPSLVRPHGLGSRIMWPKSCCGVDGASGDRALELFEVGPGASLEVPFTASTTGPRRLRLDAMVGPDFGTWAVTLDAAPLLELDAYAETPRLRAFAVPDPRLITAGAHVLVLRSTGRNARSTGLRGTFDLLSGTPP